MEPTLAAPWKKLTGEAGRIAGYGRGTDNGDTAFTTDQASNVQLVVEGALRRVYDSGDDWSFLRPVRTFTLYEGEKLVTLDDDIGALMGPVTISASDQNLGYSLTKCHITDVYESEGQNPETTGRPLKLCEEPVKDTTPTSGQRQQWHVWPIADQDYTLKASCSINGDYLTGSKPYVYGGAQYAQLFMSAVRAEAELVLLGIKDGSYDAEFQGQLAAARRLDSRNKADSLGTMRGSGRRYERPLHGHGTVTLSGYGTII